jgi:hypothetical protein
MIIELQTPNLEIQTPKTITVIGKFSANLFLTKIFDVIPLFETENFKALAFKHEGLMRDHSDGGVVKPSETEFKNSITMEILDKDCNKTRSIKIHCTGIHMCGNRSLKRAEEMAKLVTNIIVQANDFIYFASSANISWEKDIECHAFFSTMLPTIHSILPDNTTLTPLMKDRVKTFFKGIVDCGGLYERCSANLKTGTNDPLLLVSLKTVMINFSYNIEGFLRSKFSGLTKETFLQRLSDTIQARVDITREFEIFMNYDNLSSSMGWSGAVPLKFVHTPTGAIQWLTLQMRRGTIVNSGPSFGVMQQAVDVLYSILRAIV